MGETDSFGSENVREALIAWGRLTPDERAEWNKAIMQAGERDAARRRPNRETWAALVAQWQAAPDDADAWAAITAALDGSTAVRPDPRKAAAATVDPADPDLAAKLRAALAPDPAPIVTAADALSLPAPDPVVWNRCSPAARYGRVQRRRGRPGPQGGAVVRQPL